MKKSLLVAICLLSFSCMNAQTYTSGLISATLTDTMYNDSTTCSCWHTGFYHITKSSSYVGDSVKIVDTATGFLYGSYGNASGASPWTFVVSFGSTGRYDWQLLGGYVYFTDPTLKVVSGSDTISGIPSYDSFLVTNSCLYSTVSGTVYIDNNGDCIFNSGDVGLYPPNTSILENLSSSVGSLNYAGGWTSTGGGYSWGVQQSWMINYTVFLPPSYAFIFPYSPCFSGYSAFTTLPQTGIDFPLHCTSNIDVQCYALSPGNVRLHRPFYMQPYVSNTGCDTASGQLHFIKDSRVIYNASLSSYPADTVHGDTLIWNYSGLSNLSGGAYWNSFFSDVYLTPDTTIAVGDTLCFRVYTNILVADITPANNDYTICLPVVYSYDPNVKEVIPKGTGPQGYIPAGPDTLAYSLHFQNTGSDIAYNISIIDTLDSHINASSLRILGTSHNMTPKWLTSHVVQFNFDNIYLPDSGSNEAASYGEVRFSVALNTGLPLGTQIKNTGYIYFDANPPVITNTTLNTITLPNNIDQVNTNKAVKVYPNPATDHIVVENLAGGEISILNLNGVVIIKQEVANDKTIIDVSRLPDGVYILKTVDNLNTTTTRFTKY